MGSIDADAHVVECESTFNFLDPEFEKYRPLVVRAKGKKHSILSNVGVAQRAFWFMDNRMQPKEGNVGADTAKEAREMEDIE